MTIHGVTGDINRDGVLDEKRSKGRNWRQLAAVKRVLEYWRTHGHHKPHPMLALPTGFGKGVIIQRILRQLRHKKILLIVGAKNLLLDQSKQVLIDYAKQESGSTDYSVFPETSGKVVLATWQGLAAAYRRPQGLDVKFGLAIVDEVHNSGTWKRLDILRELAPDAIVGLTATAYRSTGAYKWPHEYGFEIVDAMPLPDCIIKGWLSPMAAIAIDTHVLLPKEVRETNKLNYRKINKALGNHPHLFERIATEVGTRFLPSGMKTVIIVNRIEQEACVIARILKKMGYDVGLAVNQAKSRQLSEEFITTDAISRYKLPPEHPDSIQVLSDWRGIRCADDRMCGLGCPNDERASLHPSGGARNASLPGQEVLLNRRFRLHDRKLRLQLQLRSVHADGRSSRTSGRHHVCRPRKRYPDCPGSFEVHRWTVCLSPEVGHLFLPARGRLDEY